MAQHVSDHCQGPDQILGRRGQDELFSGDCLTLEVLCKQPFPLLKTVSPCVVWAGFKFWILASVSYHSWLHTHSDPDLLCCLELYVCYLLEMKVMMAFGL